MPSNASDRFIRQRDEAFSLSDFSSIGLMKFKQREKFYHASLAAIVAAWDHFVKDLIVEYFTVLSADPDPRFSQIVSIGRIPLNATLTKFNTPNFENTRKLYTDFTGYDPIQNWNWPSRGMNWQQVNIETNAILKIRHSFAHGFSLPNVSIVSGYTGTSLRKADVSYASDLLSHLAKGMDAGLAQHAITTFSITSPW